MTKLYANKHQLWKTKPSWVPEDALTEVYLATEADGTIQSANETIDADNWQIGFKLALMEGTISGPTDTSNSEAPKQSYRTDRFDCREKR